MAQTELYVDLEVEQMLGSDNVTVSLETICGALDLTKRY